MKYQHQNREYKPDTHGFAHYVKSIGKKNVHTARAKNEEVRKSVVVDYFKNKVRNYFVSRYFAEKNWVNRHVLKNIIMLPVSVDFAFTKVQCAMGFHFFSKQQLVNAGIRPPKRREKYYHNCFVCGKLVK